MKYENHTAAKAVSAVLCSALLLTACGSGAPAPTEAVTLPSTEPVEIVTQATEERPTLATLPPQDLSALISPDYPVMAPYPQMELDNFDADKYEQLSARWYESIAAQRREPGYADGLETFWHSSMSAFLSAPNGENKVFSPLNLYMALGMLAQVTDGESRVQILTALGGKTMSGLRQQISDVWNAQYCNDGATTMLLANSLWLDQSLPYEMDTLKSLADTSMASVFAGEPGSQEMDQAYRDWINSQTDGLLSDQASRLSLDPRLVLALASTVNYRAKWMEPFPDAGTDIQVFHGSQDKEVPFLHMDLQQNYFTAEGFSALPLEMENGGGRLWLLLPEEGTAPEALLSRPETFDFLRDPYAWENNRYLTVHLAMPKFDISAGLDLKDGLSALGITDVFSPERADFSPLTGPDVSVSLTEATHAVRFAADEEGITAASFIELQMAGAGAPPEEEADFVLDRPFLFVLASNDGLPLFAGILNQP